VGGFNCLNTESKTFLDASGTGSRSSSSSERIWTSRYSGCKSCSDVGENWVATTCCPTADVKETCEGHLPIAFLDGCRRGLSLDSKLSAWWSLKLLGIVLRLSSRSLLWIDRLHLLVLERRGEWGEVQRLRVMIQNGGKWIVRKIQEVTHGTVNECIVNELKRCVKERKHWCDEKNCQDASFYPVHNSRILAFPTAHTSNSMDGRELRTRNGRGHACHWVVDWLPLTKAIIATSQKAFAFHWLIGLTSAGYRYRTTTYMIAIHGVLLLPLCLSQQQASQRLIQTSWTLSTALYASI